MTTEALDNPTPPEPVIRDGKLANWPEIRVWARFNDAVCNQVEGHATASHLSQEDTLRLLVFGLLHRHYVDLSTAIDRAAKAPDLPPDTHQVLDRLEAPEDGHLEGIRPSAFFSMLLPVAVIAALVSWLYLGNHTLAFACITVATVSLLAVMRESHKP